MHKASTIFKVPYATLHSRVKAVYPLCIRLGPSSVFSEEEEKLLVQWIINMSQRGFPITKNELLDCVQNFVKKTNNSTPFKCGRPSVKWYKSFLKRNPEIAERMSQNLTKTRASITEVAIKKWFDEVKAYLITMKLLDIDSRRIFNLNESAFCLSPKSDKVLVRKGEKAVYTVVGSDKEYYTALIGGNAAGELLPTMVIYNNERIPPLVSEHFPDDFVIGKSESGWMTTETFYMYIVYHFYTWCVKNEIEFPVLLFVDGHSSHINMELSDFCINHEIELICLYPYATYIMQPMDVALFRPLKIAYEDAVRSWRMENNGQALTKVHFASVLRNALYSLDLRKILENGFRRSGLSPFLENNINYSKLVSCNNSNKSEQEVMNASVNIESTGKPHEIVNFIESMIDCNVLENFKTMSNAEWTGAPEYKELYNFWSQCKKSSMSEVENQRICDKNQDFSHTEEIIGSTHDVVEHTETNNEVNTNQGIIDNINYLSEDSVTLIHTYNN